MGILLAFAPFIAFAVIDRLLGGPEGLVAGTLVSATLLLRDWLAPGRSPKLLEVCTFLLFAGLALFAFAGGAAWSIIGVRLRVDAGLCVIVLATLAIGRPFTLRYARERVAPELWGTPGFLRTNRVISAVWALAFAIMVAADAVLLYLPEVSPRLGIWATIIALVGTIKFTAWYPVRARQAAAS